MSILGKTSTGSFVALIVLMVIAFVIACPIFTIWSVNFLFGTAYTVSVSSWFSVFWLTFLAASIARGGK